MSKQALELARQAKVIRSSLEGRVTIHCDSDQVKSALAGLSKSQSAIDVEFSLSDLLIVSEATIQDGFIETDSDTSFSAVDVLKFRGEEVKVQVVVRVVSERSKCPRCWKWACAENEELCERCRLVEPMTSSQQQSSM